MRCQVDDLRVAQPFAGSDLLEFLGRHAVAGVESYHDRSDQHGQRLVYARTLSLSGPATLALSWSAPVAAPPDRSDLGGHGAGSAGTLTATLDLADPRDLAAGRETLDQLCDLAADPGEIGARLSADERLRPLVEASPGLRVPGVADIGEHLVRTLIGQQISLAGAASCAAKLVRRFGEALPATASSTSTDELTGELTHLFPTAAALAAADPDTLPMPRARGRALVGLADTLASGRLVLDRGDEPAAVRARLLACPGIGPWTADYVLMRAWHEPDILLSSDLAVQRELAARGISDTSRWAPWRSYATMHLWRSYLSSTDARSVRPSPRAHP